LDGREGEGEETGYRESRYIILAERRKVMSEMKMSFYGFCHWMLVYG